MLFQKRIVRVFSKLRKEKEEALEKETEKPEHMPDLEKNDFLAMVLAAFIVILPAALLALAVIGIVGFLFFFH